MVNGLFPLVTIVLSLLIYQQIPARYNLTGMVLALIGIFLMAFDEVRHAPSFVALCVKTLAARQRATSPL